MRDLSRFLSECLLRLTFPRWRITALLLVLLGFLATPMLVG